MAPPPQLSDMIETVRTDTDSDDPLEQLGTAAQAAAQITELGDQLLGYFVENARARGHSWIEISATLGVSKQAAHKRFAVTPGWLPRMERFTDRAKQCVQACAPAASKLRHPYIGTEHVLLGLYATPGSIAERILQRAGITHELAERAVLEMVGEGTEPVGDDLPFTPRAMRVFERTLRCALDWGHNYIGTEHILVALYDETEEAGIAEHILVENGLSAEDARAGVRELLAGFTEKK